MTDQAPKKPQPYVLPPVPQKIVVPPQDVIDAIRRGQGK